MGGKNSAESINRYKAKAYDRLNILVKKGEREKIKAHAETLGMSLNAFVNFLIKKDMSNNDSTKD